MSSDYAIRPVGITDAEIATTARLLQRVFPNALHFTEAVIHWQYVLNPDGHAVGFNAWAGQDLAAHYVTIPLLANVNGREERGLLSLNTATHPEHQGKGLFVRLANATYDEGASRGYGFVIGVANSNSTHGFTKRLGFQAVSPLSAMIGAGPLKMRRPEQTRYEHIWHESALRWRLSHPAYRYHLQRTHELDVVFTERTQYGARYVLAAMAKGTTPGGALPAFKSLAPFRVWIGLDCAMEWKGRPFVNIPMRFRPSPLNLIFKDLSGTGRTLEAHHVRFQAIDFDVL